MDIEWFEHLKSMKVAAEYALNTEELDGPALGIAKKVAAGEFSKLPPKQEAVLKNIVLKV